MTMRVVAASEPSAAGLAAVSTRSPMAMSLNWIVVAPASVVARLGFKDARCAAEGESDRRGIVGLDSDGLTADSGNAADDARGRGRSLCLALRLLRGSKRTEGRNNCECRDRAESHENFVPLRSISTRCAWKMNAVPA